MNLCNQVIGQHGELLLEEDIFLNIQEESQVVRCALLMGCMRTLNNGQGCASYYSLCYTEEKGIAWDVLKGI